jgi:hypothetical protein
LPPPTHTSSGSSFLCVLCVSAFSFPSPNKSASTKTGSAAKSPPSY